MKTVIPHSISLASLSISISLFFSFLLSDLPADLREMDSFGSLHHQIKACDQILETMETLLRGFQADLGNISDEIKILQDRSTSLNVQLQNRKVISAHHTNKRLH